jgi:Uroporphyrinogen decarboxylase (URO-D)
MEMRYYLDEKIDFEQHNAEVKQLLHDYCNNTHKRVPIIVNGSISSYFCNPYLNNSGFSFKDFFVNPEAQLKCQLEYQYYKRHNYICDIEMGLPEKEWNIGLDFQNSYDQAWFGCPFCFFDDNDVPDTHEILKGNPKEIYDWQDADPFWGRGDFMKNAADMMDKIKEICAKGYEFHGLPVSPPCNFPVIETDGIFTLALKLCGTVEIMTAMLLDPEYYHYVMDYLTRNMIARRKAHVNYWKENYPDFEEKFHICTSFVDDSIAMLSLDQFKEFVLPYWKRYLGEFYDGSGLGIHLCGDATHLFKFLVDEFNVISFDTGFPVDHGKLRKELGPNVQIQGGPTIMMVKDENPEVIDREVKRICESGVKEGGKFILIAANNLAPCTPIENIKALYKAGKKYGTLQ